MNRRLSHPVAAVLLLGLGACGGKDIQLAIDGRDDAMNAVSAFVVPNSHGGHSIQITNYPVEMGERYDYAKIRPTALDQYRLDLNIIKAPASGKMPLRVGEYAPRPGNRSPKDKLVWARVMRFDEGREKTAVNLSGEDFEGTLSITSADGDSVSGRIDVSDGRSSIQGDFSAKLLR